MRCRGRKLLRDAVERHGGTVFKTVGDGVYAVFADAPSSIRAAVAGQRLLLSQHWPGMVDGDDLLVRLAIHTGEADTHDGDYFGPTNRLSRTLAAGHGGQILCTHETVPARGDAWPEGNRAARSWRARPAGCVRQQPDFSDRRP
ncbi:MAG: adenylate/guanylate cyclase domain-containing protein [Thermomicrobiales bacterium]